MVGIYKITNQINNKVYVGQSSCIERRWAEHLYYSENEQTLLQRAFKKYGITNFKFEVLEECEPQNLNEREIYWINFYNSFENGYNMTPGGENHSHIQVSFEKLKDDYLITNSIHQTARNYNTTRTSVRKALELYDIEYNSTNSAPISILMLNPFTLEIIKVFPSIMDAANYAKISDSAIRKALTNSTKPYSGGYFWLKSEDEKNISLLTPLASTENKPVGRKAQAVEQYTLQGEKIAEFKSISQANLALGKSRSNENIKRVCQGQQQEACGYQWKYKEG